MPSYTFFSERKHRLGEIYEVQFRYSDGHVRTLYVRVRIRLELQRGHDEWNVEHCAVGASVSFRWRPKFHADRQRHWILEQFSCLLAESGAAHRVRQPKPGTGKYSGFSSCLSCHDPGLR